MTQPPIAMISYSWKDSAAAELLHDEFALRGFSVLHDRHSFTEGSRIATNMASGVETCDVFVAYLTRHSLYLEHRFGGDRPALIGELLPALRRRRRNLRPGQVDSPIIIPLARGLGDRIEAGQTIRRATGEDFASLWVGGWLDQATGQITPLEAARIADEALRAFLTRDTPISPINLHVDTRGNTPPASRFTIDGTRLLGGHRHAGSPAGWRRFYDALQSVAANLAHHTGGGPLHVDPACHLSAALAVGRTFHQATRWSLTVASRHGDTAPAHAIEAGHVKGAFDQYSESGDLMVEMDLLGHNVGALSDQLAATVPLGGRISLVRSWNSDLTATDMSQSARYVADKIRAAHAVLRPSRIHITISAPAAFAVLLGHHLTALEADLITYELDGGAYIAALRLNAQGP